MNHVLFKNAVRSIITITLSLLFLSFGCSTGQKSKKFVIGFSQVTVKEPWRVVFNEKLRQRAEELKDKLDLIMLDADDKTENQVEHVRTFITKRVDAILISPKEASGCSKVIQEATEAGIPVIVLDRETTCKDYAAFVGGDNMEIGRAAGAFVVNLLGGKGAAKGTVYEICGGLASTPAQERRDGFHEIVEKEPGITILGGLDGDWKLDRAKAIAQDALKLHKNIDRRIIRESYRQKHFLYRRSLPGHRSRFTGAGASDCGS